MSEGKDMLHKYGEMDIDFLRGILTEIIGAQISKRRFSVTEEFDRERAETVFSEICREIFDVRMDYLRMILFIYARVLKEDFMKEAFEQASSRNRFFRYTISLTWRKDSLDFDSTYMREPEKSGRLDGLYWCIRSPILKKGGGTLGYRYERLINPHPDRPYSRRSFRGAETWEKDLIMKYEVRFAVIRKMLTSIGNMKRSGYQFRNDFARLTSENPVMDQEDTDFNFEGDDLD